MTKAMESFTVQTALEELDKLKKEELYSLTDCGYKGINVFHSTGMSGQEIRHSAFIAWLLNPKMEHGLNDTMVREFFKKIYSFDSQESYNGVPAKKNSEIIKDATQGNVVDEKSFLALLNGDIEVRTEVALVSQENRIDLLLENKQTQTVMVVENKFHSDAHTDQLRRYQNDIEAKYQGYRNKLFVFLTPKGQLPVNIGGDEQYNDGYCILSYKDIIDIISMLKQAVKNSTSLNKTNKSKLNILLEDYVEMLNIEALAKNADVRKKCKEIIKDYELAINLLKMYVDNSQDVFDFCIEWLQQELPDAKIEISGKKNSASVYFSTEVMREYYKSYGESVDTHKAYKFGTEAGNVIKFFIIMDHAGKPDWTNAQKVLVPEQKLGNTYSNLGDVLLMTWEDREKDINEVKPILIPILQKIKNKIIENDKLLASHKKS